MSKLGRLILVGVAATLLASGPLLAITTQARVGGKVVNSKGEGVAGAVLTLTTPEMTDFTKKVEVKDDGTFSFLLLDATLAYKVHVEAPGYVPLEQELKVPAGSTDKEFTYTLMTREEGMHEQQQKLLEQPGYKEINEANELLKAGKDAEARAKFAAAVAAKPDLTAAWGAMAELDYKDKNYKSALTNAEKCLELDNESSQCLAVAANATKELGDDAAHMAYLKRYQEANPDDPATVFNQAAEYLNKMDDEHARPLLEQCLQIDPDFAKCLFEYGMLLLRTGDMAGAKAQLEHYLEVAPDAKDAATARETLKYL